MAALESEYSSAKCNKSTQLCTLIVYFIKVQHRDTASQTCKCVAAERIDSILSSVTVKLPETHKCQNNEKKYEFSRKMHRPITLQNGYCNYTPKNNSL